uniref:Uncharacterized protein n=1 Tax=Anguilla anguilla TaxID=7936 RepID=A0A0E9W452_ANGAN
MCLTHFVHQCRGNFFFKITKRKQAFVKG